MWWGRPEPDILLDRSCQPCYRHALFTLFLLTCLAAINSSINFLSYNSAKRSGIIDSASPRHCGGLPLDRKIDQSKIQFQIERWTTEARKTSSSSKYEQNNCSRMCRQLLTVIAKTTLRQSLPTCDQSERNQLRRG